ncbi:MAG TPA: PSD1 and planctomycete cytochrome C domain-containing protein [Gemmata sp.]
MRTLLALALLPFGAAPALADDVFESSVRPLLVRHCIGCHGPEKQKGGLRLDSKAGWQTGGDSGPAIQPGKPDASILIKAVHGRGGLAQMPPKEKLTEHEIAALTKWVRDGAIDPRAGGPVKFGGTTLEAAKKWWAFQPVKRPAVPKSAFTNPVDAFIGSKLTERQLQLAPPADKRTLIRRATYDLTGLPPAPGEVEAFLKDESPDAFAKVVDRLLASPHYGERWGRHWLDLVRYADTAGENSDHPLPHAWRYRNWVIDSFNRDQPYDEFLREQLAGDILAANGPPEKYAPRVIATGYLALARRFDHDSDKFMHLTHEDGIDTLGKAFLGLTLGCARCHDHKYDAITARDYYALYGILESTKFAFPGCEAKQQPRDLVPLLPPAEWDRVVKPYQEKLARLDAEIGGAGRAGTKQAQAAQVAFAKNRNLLSQGEVPDGGAKTFGTNEIEVNAGEMVLLSITPLKNHGADTTLLEFELAEVGGSKRVWNVTSDLLGDSLAGNPHADGHGNAGVWWLFDARNQPTLLPEHVRDVSGKPGLHAWRNGDTPSVLVNSAPGEASVWAKLPGRSLFVHPAANGNVAVGWLSPITGKVTIKGRIRDAHPGGPDGVGWVLERFAVDVRKPFFAQAEAAGKVQTLTQERAELVKRAPKQEVAFAVVEGRAGDAKLHLRGDPEKLGDVVPRRWLEVLGGAPIANKATSGRLDLAGWVASKDNPLTARVMANRIWLHHFGQGLVKTPNDFGTRGTPPTHPELLDWLAAEFVKGNWSVKALHRAIMLSQTYQQDAAHRDAAAKRDPTNELYWRFERRRLSAEEMRDSLLAASGQLDRKPAGAHPFPPEAAWGYTQHVPFGTFFETDKRSAYLVQVRNRRHPFLGLFDGADPNATTPQRQTTTVPTQALYFLNDPFFHAQAEKLANRVLAEPEADRVSALFRTTLQRAPTDRDRAFAAKFLARYKASLGNSAGADRAAWAALGRIVLASNEFLFVE